MTLNHTVPIAVLFVDFWVNCVPFVPRHYLMFSLGCTAWVVWTTLTKTNLDHPFEHLFSWNESEVGLLVPIMVIPIGWIIHLLLTWCNRKKMQYNNKSDALEQLEELYKQITKNKKINKQFARKSAMLNISKNGDSQN